MPYIVWVSRDGSEAVMAHTGRTWPVPAANLDQPRRAGTSGLEPLVRACSWNVRAPSGVMIALACLGCGTFSAETDSPGQIGMVGLSRTSVVWPLFPWRGSTCRIGELESLEGKCSSPAGPSGPGLQPSLLQGGACDLILNVLELSLQGAQGLKFCRGSFRRNY